MVIQIFLINLKTALQHKHPYFKTLYNKEVLQLIDELIKLKVISYVRYAENERRIEVVLNLNINKYKYIRLTNMCSRKKQRTWTIGDLIKNSRNNQTYILKTNQGYRDSHYCIKKHISGYTILRVEY